MEVLLSTGKPIQTVGSKIGVTEQTYCRWRKKHGGMKIDQTDSSRW
jgi:hypothetical protein